MLVIFYIERIILFSSFSSFMRIFKAFQKGPRLGHVQSVREIKHSLLFFVFSFFLKQESVSEFVSV